MRRKFSKLSIFALVIILVLSSVVVCFGADPDGITVQYNGENVVFEDAKPKIIDNRTMVPFRQILETMGAEVSYDKAAKTVSAVTDDLEIKFAVGSKDIHVTKDGVTTIKQTDVAPLIDKTTNRTYVAARFIAESMGNFVGWDHENKTAIIIDLQQLFAKADEDFSILSKLMSTNLDLEKAYETTGDFKADVTFNVPGEPSETKNMNLSMNGSMRGIQQKTDVDMVMNLSIDIDPLLANMTPEEKALFDQILEMYKDISMKIKMDGESGDMYMNSPMFTITDPTLTADNWFKMNMYELYDAMGIDIRPMMEMSQSEIKISELLPLFFVDTGAWNIDTYNNIKISYAFLKNLLGDEAFNTTMSGTIKTHKLTLSQTQILAAVVKTALSEGIPTDSADLKDISAFIEAMDLSGNIVIREKGGVLYDYSLKGSGSYDGHSLNLELTGNNLNSLITMNLIVKDIMEMSIEADSKITQTTKAPDLTLPEGTKVIDYNEYLSQVMTLTPMPDAAIPLE